MPASELDSQNLDLFSMPVLISLLKSLPCSWRKLAAAFVWL